MTPSRALRFPPLAAVLCISAGLAAGCGSSSTSLAGVDAAKLHRDVAGIRLAAAGHNPAAAHAAVRTLEADVAQLRAAGKLAPADAAVLVTDAGQVDRRVTLEVRAPAAPAPSTQAPATPAPATPAAGPGDHGKPGKPGKHGKGDGNGNGNGGGGGDGGD